MGIVVIDLSVFGKDSGAMIILIIFHGFKSIVFMTGNFENTKKKA